MTIEQVAEKVGVSASCLSTWEGAARIQPEFKRAWKRRPWVRYYTPVQVLQFQAIAELRERGLPLPAAIAGADDLVVEWWRMASTKPRPGGRVDGEASGEGLNSICSLSPASH